MIVEYRGCFPCNTVLQERTNRVVSENAEIQPHVIQQFKWSRAGLTAGFTLVDFASHVITKAVL